MEPIVSLEIAKKLKAEGYKKPTTYFYQDKNLPFSDKGLKHVKNSRKMNHNRYDEFIYSAPTIIEYENWINRKQNTEDDGN